MKVMPKYMVIFNWRGSDLEEFKDSIEDYRETTASFYEDYIAAANAKMDAECGLGAYAEVYIREEVTEDGESCGFDAYRLLYA